MKPITTAIGWVEFQYPNPDARIKVVNAVRAACGGDNDKFMEDLRRYCRIYDTTHVSGDSHSTALNEGKRQVYMHIVSMLEINPNDLKPKPTKGNTDERDTERPADADD